MDDMLAGMVEDMEIARFHWKYVENMPKDTAGIHGPRSVPEEGQEKEK